MANIETLTRQLQYARKQKSYAWAKFYEARNENLGEDHIQHQRIVRIVESAEPLGLPKHLMDEFKEMAKALEKKWECPICMGMIPDGDLAITNCGHFYCKDCLEAWKRTEKQNGNEKWKCGMCNRKHNFGDE